MRWEGDREREVQDNRAVTIEQRRRLRGDDLFPPACYPLSQLGLCSMNNIWRRPSALFCVLRNRATSTRACTTRATRCTHARTHACTLANRMLRSPPPAQSTRFPATCPRLSRRAYPSRAKLRRIQAPLRRKGISKTPTLNFFRPETREEISFPKFSRTEEAPIQVRLPPGVVIILRK